MDLTEVDECHKLLNQFTLTSWGIESWRSSLELQADEART